MNMNSETCHTWATIFFYQWKLKIHIAREIKLAKWFKSTNHDLFHRYKLHWYNYNVVVRLSRKYPNLCGRASQPFPIRANIATPSPSWLSHPLPAWSGFPFRSASILMAGTSFTEAGREPPQPLVSNLGLPPLLHLLVTVMPCKFWARFTLLFRRPALILILAKNIQVSVSQTAMVFWTVVSVFVLFFQEKTVRRLPSRCWQSSSF